jgi:plastocyanin
VPDDDATPGDEAPDAPDAPDAAGSAAEDAAPGDAAPADTTAAGVSEDAAAAEPTSEEREDVRALTAGSDPNRELRWTRLLLPVLLPVGAAVMIAVFVLNVSRIFLAAGSTGSIVLGVALIVLILGGAAGISAAPRLRTSSIVMMVSGVFIVVISAGLVAAPASVESKSGPSGYVPPKGPAIATLEVDALGTLAFDQKSYSVPAGIIQINYVSKDGPHNLSFDPPGPQINVNVPANGTVSTKVLLKAGTYVIFCNLPGHRAAGMEATLTAH